MDRFRQLLGIVDRSVDRFGYWVTFFGILGNSTVMAAIISQWSAIASQGWAAVVVVAITFGLAITPVLSWGAIAYSHWHPRSAPAPASAPTSVTQQPGSIQTEPAAPTPQLQAFAYLDPPDRNQLIVRWTSPIREDRLSLALDYRPVGEGVRRLLLRVPDQVVKGQTVDTRVCFKGTLDFWVWNGSKPNDLMPMKTTMCRFVVIAADGAEHYWRFGVADRDSKDRPRVIGENVFDDGFL